MTPPRQDSDENTNPIQRLRAFGDAEVQLQLQLTDDQREEIRTILRQGFQEARPIRESLAELQRRTLEKATAVLTDEQKSELEQLQEHFEVEQGSASSMSQGGPRMRGGPGMGRGAGMRRPPMGEPRMGRGPGMRRPPMGGPRMRGQRMGGPRMGRGPGMRRPPMGEQGVRGGHGIEESELASRDQLIPW